MSKLKLCQALAIESSVRNKSREELTTLHRSAERPELYNGLDRKYQPKDEDGEKFPSENQRVQLTAKDVLAKLRSVLSESYNIELTKDAGNLLALADVKVDGAVLLEKVPVSYLLYLEKQLEDLNTFVKKMPILDASETWSWDPGQVLFRSVPVETAKTKKVMKAVVLYPHSDKHPAQVEKVTEDVVVGHWQTTKFTGALTVDRKELLLSKLAKLQQAVKFAREEANSVEVEKKNAADPLFNYLLG